MGTPANSPNGGARDKPKKGKTGKINGPCNDFYANQKKIHQKGRQGRKDHYVYTAAYPPGKTKSPWLNRCTKKKLNQGDDNSRKERPNPAGDGIVPRYRPPKKVKKRHPEKTKKTHTIK